MKHLSFPKGFVRSCITLSSVLVYYIAMFFQMFWTLPVPETMNSVVLTVIAFYFGVRSVEETQKRTKRK